jgi:hypothetical protein
MEKVARTHTTEMFWWHGVPGYQTLQHSDAGKARLAAYDFPRYVMFSCFERKVFFLTEIL